MEDYSVIFSDLGITGPAVFLDVRTDLRLGREPFDRIMDAFEGLGPGQSLAVRSTFEPKPLLVFMASRGCAVRRRELGPQDWLSVLTPEARP
jgi:hypothetical protein